MDSSEKHIWDVSWSTDEIRKHGQTWSLAADAGLLNKLQDMAQGMISHTHHIQQEVVSLVQETEATDSRLHNIINDCLMLSNTQFVESRVYDEEVSDFKTETKNNSPQKENDEKKEAEIIAKVADALHLGMSVIDTMLMPLSDSEEVCSFEHDVISQPKNKYKDRLLPYVIGSQLFMDDDYVGLGRSIVEELSDHLPNENDPTLRKLSVRVTEKKSESGSSRNSDIFNDDANEQSDDYSVTKAEDNDLIKPSKADLEKELFVKLTLVQEKNHSDYEDSISNGSSNSDIISSPKVKERRNQVPVKSSTKASKRTKVTESSTPDNVEEELNNDDHFGNTRMFSSKGGLFDNDDNDEDDLFMNSKDIGKSKEHSLEKRLFKEIADEFQKSTVALKPKMSKSSSLLEDNLFSDDKDDNDLFTKATVKIEHKKDKKDHHSIFEDEDDDDDKMSDFLLGSKQASFAPLESPKKLEDDERWSSQTSLSNKSITFQEIVKESPSSGSNKSSALFVEEPDVDDLFSAPFEKHSGGGILFSNDDDDVEDIFAVKPASKSDKLRDDIFKDSSVSKPTTKKSILFDDDDDLFAVTRSQQTKSFGIEGHEAGKTIVNSITESKQISKPSEASRKSFSLFDDTSDVTEDLFSDLLPSQSDRPSSSGLSTNGKIFLDDDLLFGRATADNPEVNLFDDHPIQSPKMKDGSKHANVDNVTQKHSVPPTPSRRKGAEKLFDDEDNEDDLFSNLSTSKKKSDVPVSPLPTPRKGSSHLKENVNAEQKVSGSQHTQETSSVMDSPRKKPIGGVVCFGGVIPPLLKHPTTPNPTTIQEKSTESGDYNAPTLPGAYIIPPVSTDKPSTEIPVSFDNPVEANVLHNTNKDRVKIQVKRRLPTRRGRQEALRKSAIDILTDGDGINDKINDLANHIVASVSAPTSPLSPEPDKATMLPSSAMEPTTKLTVESTRATNIASPSTEEEDIFVVGDPVISPLTGHLRTVPTTRSKFISGDDISPSKTFDEKGLFSNSVDDEDIDDLFKPKLHSVTTVQKFPNTKSSPRPPRKSSRSSNDMLLPSGEKDSVPLAADDMKPTSSPKKSESTIQGERTPDIFANLGKGVQSKHTTSETSVKSKSRLDAPKPGKSLFDDDDDDDGDLFKAGSSIKSNAKIIGSGVTTTKKPSPLKTQSKFDSLFNDVEDDDLFEDPLTKGKAN